VNITTADYSRREESHAQVRFGGLWTRRGDAPISIFVEGGQIDRVVICKVILVLLASGSRNFIVASFIMEQTLSLGCTYSRGQFKLDAQRHNEILVRHRTRQEWAQTSSPCC